MNYNGVRIRPRISNRFVMRVGSKYYYLDIISTLRGPYDTEELARTGLLKYYNEKRKENDTETTTSSS